MATMISDTEMTSDQTPVTCTWRPDAAGPGRGAWTSTLPGLGARRPLTRDQAITAMALAERMAAKYADDDPFMQAWRAELGIGAGVL